MRLFILLLLFGCSSKGKIKIISQPQGANVVLRQSDNSTKSLGKTPLEFSSSSIMSSNSDLNALVISHDGFHEQHIMLASDDQSYEINAKLKAIIDDAKTAETKSKQEKLAQQILSANQMIRQKRLLDAENLLNGVIREFPFVSVGYDLMGNVSYLKKDLQRALNYYEKSLHLNPDNIETRQMIERLKGLGQPIQ